MYFNNRTPFDNNVYYTDGAILNKYYWILLILLLILLLLLLLLLLMNYLWIILITNINSILVYASQSIYKLIQDKIMAMMAVHWNFKELGHLFQVSMAMPEKKKEKTPKILWLLFPEEFWLNYSSQISGICVRVKDLSNDFSTELASNSNIPVT